MKYKYYEIIQNIMIGISIVIFIVWILLVAGAI